ncbi:hypothetical protein Tco_0168617 [Tanacetum coccineum]
MADLEFVDQHNMLACLEKTIGNSEFHEIMDFLISSLIHHALTVNPTIYISYIEQFWNTSSSQTINDEKQIHATIDSKEVVVTEASIRSSLLLNDADGTACLTNEGIFQNLALMGYEAGMSSQQILLQLFVMVFLNNRIELGEPFNDVYVTPAHTQKVFSNMSRKGVKFSGKVTPLFDSMVVPHQAPEGEDFRDSLEGTIRSEGDQVQPSHDSPLSGGPISDRAEGGMTLKDLSVLCTNLSNRVLALEASKDAEVAEIIKLKTRIKKLKKKSHPVISHNRAWLRSVSRLSMKRKLGRKDSISKQGRKNAKPKHEPTLDAFDDLDANGRDYMEKEDVLKEGRQSNETEEFNKGSGEKGGSTKGPVSTVVPKIVSTARPELSTARPDVDAARQEDSVVEPRTPPTTTSIFNDEDITMAQTLIKMKEEKAKEKGVSIKDVEDSSRPARSTLTLKPLPTIDPKDKGKSVLEEPEPAKKMTRSDFDAAQIARDAEIARQLQVDLQAEVERERQREEEASKAAIAEMYDEVQAGIDADALFAAKLQQEEREEYTIEERAKFLAETIAAQRKFRAAQRSAEIRSRPPTKSQLRNLMMTYLKNMGGYKHSQLKAKSFEEIKGMYERQKKSVQDFVPIGSAKEEELIKKMNEKATDEDTSNKEKVLEEPDSTKVEVKQEGHEDSTRKRPGRRLKMKATKKSKRQKTDADLKEEEQLKVYLKIVPDEDGIIDYEVMEKRFPIINWESKFYDFDRHGAECIYYRIFRSNGSSRWIKTFSEMVTRFDRLNLLELYNLVMKRFETTTPEGVDLVLWGDLRTMFDANAEDELWQNQERWNLKSWDFYENCGVHTLRLEDGTEIHMLAERKYPLTKETLKRMLSLSKELASPKQTALGKDISNPLIVDSLLKTIWLSMHHVIAMKHWLFQSKRLLGRIVGIQKFLQLSAATYTSYYCQFYLVLLMKNAIDSRK